jgi:3-oxoacyl-[acyl-carrier-protein] synthase-1
MNIYVAGIGLVSSLGIGVSQNYDALVSQRHGICSFSQELDPLLEGFPVGRLRINNFDLAEIASASPRFPRTALMSLLAANEAIEDVGLDIRNYRSGFISATTVGGIDLTEQFFISNGKNKLRGNLHKIVNHECGRVTNLVAEKIEVNTYVSTISTACSSSANSIILAARLIKEGRLDIAVAGGADALTAFTLNGFNSLLLLDTDLCIPFDAKRKGLNLGEGAGYVILVSERLVDAGVVSPIVILSGYSNTCDAFHQTAMSPEGKGPFLSMSGALRMAGITPSGVNYINAHGTATQNNDASEGNAVCRLFKNNIPALSSTKCYTGHTLGASGGIEAIFSILALTNGVAFPNLRFSEPIPELALIPVTEVQHFPMDNVLTNSFGFGGNCSSLVFSKILV